MGWKDLIFASSGDDEKKGKKEMPAGDAQKTFKSKFPTSNVANEATTTTTAVITPTAVAPAITPDNPACTPHLDKIMGMYESGFDSLNIDGYDFYEYFKTVIEGGVNNPTVYTMAFTMGKAMDKGLSKESLLSQSQFYIDEITKVHKSYVEGGNTSRQQAITAKNSEENALTTELAGINAEIQRLNSLKLQKEAELAKIDAKFQPQITDVECKLMANDMAMEAIVGSIQKVVQGINTNVLN